MKQEDENKAEAVLPRRANHLGQGTTEPGTMKNICLTPLSTVRGSRSVQSPQAQHTLGDSKHRVVSVACKHSFETKPAKRTAAFTMQAEEG